MAWTRIAMLALWLAASASARAQPIDFAARVDAIADEALRRGPVAGMSIAVARPHQAPWARGYGLASLEHEVAVAPATVFHVASVSKQFAAAALLACAELGKLGLDDPLSRFVPEAPAAWRAVTVRQLVEHTSGIHSLTSLPNIDALEHRAPPRAEVLAQLARTALDFPPGTRWRYSNSGFWLAGLVVERASGQSYATFLRERLFAPAGMTSSSLCDGRSVVPHLASGYEPRDGKLVPVLFDWGFPWAAGAVCATASDLVAWQAALDGGRILSARSLVAMRTPLTLADGTRIDYGLGTRLGTFAGHRVLGHTGTGAGFNAILLAFPDDHVTVVALANGDPGGAFAVAARVARVVLGVPAAPPADLPVPAAEQAAIVGTYDSDEGPVELFARGDRLRFRVPGGPPDGWPMPRAAENRYVLDDHREVRMLVRRGRAEWGVVYDAGLMLDAKYRVK